MVQFGVSRSGLMPQDMRERLVVRLMELQATVKEEAEERAEAEAAEGAEWDGILGMSRRGGRDGGGEGSDAARRQSLRPQLPRDIQIADGAHLSGLKIRIPLPRSIVCAACQCLERGVAGGRMLQCARCLAHVHTGCLGLSGSLEVCAHIREAAGHRRKRIGSGTVVPKTRVP